MNKGDEKMNSIKHQILNVISREWGYETLQKIKTGVSLKTDSPEMGAYNLTLARVVGELEITRENAAETLALLLGLDPVSYKNHKNARLYTPGYSEAWDVLQKKIDECLVFLPPDILDNDLRRRKFRNAARESDHIWWTLDGSFKLKISRPERRDRWHLTIGYMGETEVSFDYFSIGHLSARAIKVDHLVSCAKDALVINLLFTHADDYPCRNPDCHLTRGMATEIVLDFETNHWRFSNWRLGVQRLWHQSSSYQIRVGDVIATVKYDTDSYRPTLPDDVTLPNWMGKLQFNYPIKWVEVSDDRAYGRIDAWNPVLEVFHPDHYTGLLFIGTNPNNYVEFKQVEGETYQTNKYRD
jgi:hypothetical protein